MVASNVLLDVFLMKILGDATIFRITKTDVLTWPPMILQTVAIEIALISGALAKLLADSSYWAYLIHLPIVLFLQTLLIPVP
jgi:hypothetical protein